MRVLSVSEFRDLVNELLSPLAVAVEGEISQISVSQNRWGFLTIKDDEANLNVFAPLFKVAGFSSLKEGMLVKVYGVPSLYKNGRFSLQAEEIVPSGKGALRAAFEKLKEELARLGYFDEKRKRPLPELVQRIGLITAPGSRAYSDFVKIINQQQAGLKIDFYPVTVQGKEAVESIRKAFAFFNHQAGLYDLVALVRGGGSAEDLFIFNTQEIVETIYGSKVPVIVGIGHEKDETLADLVADWRTPTPTAAAQAINEINRQRTEEVAALLLFFSRHLERQISLINQELGTIIANFTSPLRREREEVVLALDRYRQAILSSGRLVSLWQREREALVGSLRHLDYHQTLKRGFTLTYNRYGRIVKDPRLLSSGEKVITQFLKGKLVSRVVGKN